MTDEAVDAVEDTDVAETPVDSHVTETAHEVIAGKWGRGNARKERLRDAGFDPSVVQKEVDKIFDR